MAAWSFQRKGEAVGVLARAIDAESLDGHRVRGRLSVRFQRAVSQELAEQITTGISNEVVEVIGEALCHDGLPFTAEELIATVRGRSLSASAKGLELRVDGLDVVDAAGATPTARPVARDERTRARSGTSGVMPTVGRATSRPAPAGAEASSTAPRTLWPRATAAVAADHDVERLGRLFAPCLRDSSASVVLAALAAVDPLAVDRLGLLEARPAPHAMVQLKREACWCLAAVLWRALVGESVERAAASSIVGAALDEALAPETLSPAELRRYVESPAPLRDLASRAAALLGSPQDAPRILSAMSDYATALRAELQSTAAEVQRHHGVT